MANQRKRLAEPKDGGIVDRKEEARRYYLLRQHKKASRNKITATSVLNKTYKNSVSDKVPAPKIAEKTNLSYPVTSVTEGGKVHRGETIHLRRIGPEF